VFSSGLGLRVDRALLDLVDDVRKYPRYTDKSAWKEGHDVDYARASGANLNANIPKGGFWNNPDRAGQTPFTLADVDLMRGNLRALGIPMPKPPQEALQAAKEAIANAETAGRRERAQKALRALKARVERDYVDGLLLQALHGTGFAERDDLLEAQRAHEAFRAVWRAERAVKTAKRRAAGKCVKCGKDAGGKATCAPCGAKANARRSERRRLAREAANPLG